MDEHKFSISRTVQAQQYEPVVYTSRGDTSQEAIDGLRELMEAYPPIPYPKAETVSQKSIQEVNKEFALASEKESMSGADDPRPKP